MEDNNRTALVVTGTIAAIKTIPLIEELKAAGKDVAVILTHFPEKYGWVKIDEAQASSSHKVLTAESPLPEKIYALEAAQAILVLSSADFAAQVVYKDPGLGQAMAEAQRRGTALAFVPAMNYKIWEHPAVRKNFASLHKRGVLILGPVKGPMACGDEGYGRMIDVKEMVEGLQAALEGKDHPAFGYYKKASEASAAKPGQKTLRPAKENSRLLIVLCGDVDMEKLIQFAADIKRTQTPVDWVVDPNLENKSEILSCLEDQTVITDHYQITNAEGKKDGMEHIRLPEGADLVICPFLNDATAKAMLEGRGGTLCLDIALASKAPVVTTLDCAKALSPNTANGLSEIGVATIDAVPFAKPGVLPSNRSAQR